MANRKKERVAAPAGGAQASVTLIDVARVAGVSPITVSRALGRPDLVRPDTVSRVQAAVRETGYVKNMLAGGLASNRSRLVAYVLPTVVNSIFSESVQAATDTLAKAGYQLLLGLSGYEPWREELLVETVLSRRPDGIILTGASHTDNTRKRLLAAGIPVVETWDLTPAPIDIVVGFSHEQVGHAVAAHLLERGYRRFAILSIDDPRAARRGQGLQAALARQGISLAASEIMPGPASLQAGRQGTGRLLDGGRGCDVIVCSSDTLAHGALTEAASRGLSVPGDVAVMGFGDSNFAEHTFPPLSSVNVDTASIGAQAAQALLNRLNNQPGRTVTDTGFSLRQRGST